jgi:predicted MFS family arabinose efflux permease
MYAYIADITTVQERTRRLAIFDSFIPLGALLSIPTGTFIREMYGFVTVFAISTSIGLLTLLITVIFVKDSQHRSDYQLNISEKQTGPERSEAVVNSDSTSDGWHMIFKGINVLLRARQLNGRTWILAILAIFTISSIIELGDSSLW